MKTKITFLLLALGLIAFKNNKAQSGIKTTTASGNWNNPSIWSPVGVPNYTESAVIINHVVTYTTSKVILTANDSIVINSGGKIIGPNSNDSIISADLLKNRGVICSHLIILGDSTYNSGTISASGRMSTDLFMNTSTGKIYCSDTLIVGADMTNNGMISTASLINSEELKGSGGKICIANTFVNGGDITGTQDVCDATPGGFFDVTGTLGSNITICATGPCSAIGNACSISTGFGNEMKIINDVTNVYPNPFKDNLVIKFNSENNSRFIKVFTILGEEVLSMSANQNVVELTNLQMVSGIYFLSITDKSGIIKTVKIVKE